MEEIKCNELPQEITLTNTLKLIGNSDNKIKQIGIDLLRDYVTNTLQGQLDIIQDYIGNLNDLSTTQKDSLVNAVKEVDDKIDVLSTDIANTQTNVAELNSALSTLKTKTIGCYTGTGTVSTPLIAGTWNTWIDAPAIGKTPLAIIPTWSNTNVVLQLRYQSGSIQILPQAAVNNITIQYAILYFIF